MQHISCGSGDDLGGLIIKQSDDNKIEHFGTAGWIAAISTLATIWLATRLHSAGRTPTSAEAISLEAAAEACVDAPMLSCNE